MNVLPEREEYSKPHEECGVFGIYSPEGVVHPAFACYNGLLSLQHRGQESCGIAVNQDGVISYSKDMGLVTEAFCRETLEKLDGQIAVAHVRYSTAGGSVRENAQPLVMRYAKGTLAIAHNGNLTNASELKQEMQQVGCIFQTTIDSEVIAYVIARERLHCHSIEEAVVRTLDTIKGAYSLLVMSPQKLIAARDPHGFRPLCMGRIGEDTWVFASETCALDACGAEFVRDLEPGEIVMVGPDGMKTYKKGDPSKKALCIFEYIYFARTDSVIDGVSVYEARKNAGRLLAKESPVAADMVIGVPESGVDAAIGYSEESGIPFQKGIVRNSYIGRTFIKPTQEERARSVQLKLNAIAREVAGKRVIMLDDSIVRGTTSGRIVRMLREAGAKEVHVRISSPPFLWPCYYGTDIPSKEELIACQHSVDEICAMLGADSLAYLSLDALHHMIPRRKGFCDACFTGHYPAEIPDLTSYSKIDQYCMPIKRV